MRIGFLALSGLRAHDKKLVELGMTLPGVQDRAKVLSALPSLGLLFLAASTPEGHELEYFEAEGDGSEPAEVYDCDLVAINTFSAQVFEAYAIADRLRAAGVQVAMGGLHVSVQPEEALQHADYIFLGEGEQCWRDAVPTIATGNAKRIWDARSSPPMDVRKLPEPRYDLLQDRGYTRFPVQTTRGCPWRCDFCASNVMFGYPYRKRPVKDIIRDVVAIKKIKRRPFIEFADDNTFVDRQWGKDLCRELIFQRIKWFTETDISVADDPEQLDLMHRSGCKQVLIGIESPNQSTLDGIELNANFKSRVMGDMKDAVQRIQSTGITVNGCFILGLDQQTPEIFEQVLDFANQAQLWDVQITVMTPFPGTPLYDRLNEEGRLLYPRRWDRCTLFDVNFQPRGMTVEQLEDGMRWLAKRLYSREAIAARRRHFVHRANV